MLPKEIFTLCDKYLCTQYFDRLTPGTGPMSYSPPPDTTSGWLLWNIWTLKSQVKIYEMICQEMSEMSLDASAGVPNDLAPAGVLR